MFVLGDPIVRPDGCGQGTMDDAVETSAECVRDHLRRPIPGSRNLLMETAGNTVSEIVPGVVIASLLRRALEGFVIVDAFPFLGDSMTDYGVAAIHDARLSLSGHVTDESEIEEGVRDVAQVVDPDTGDLHGVHRLDELDNVGEVGAQSRVTAKRCG